jgi:hypothetical protein
MGKTTRPSMVTPLAAVLYGRETHFATARRALTDWFGSPLLESAAFPFNATKYYEKEMGANLLRRFLFFDDLSDPAELAAWKIRSNELERELAEILRAGEREAPPRPVNIDVGYLTAAKLVLASTKDFAHRLYLRDGIFGEITLSWRKDRWTAHQFTFPDFQSGTYDEVLTQARFMHMRKTKNERSEPTAKKDHA